MKKATQRGLTMLEVLVIGFIGQYEMAAAFCSVRVVGQDRPYALRCTLASGACALVPVQP